MRVSFSKPGYMSSTTYVIKNQLFQSDKSEEIGTEVPLELIYPGLEKETRIKGLSRPLCDIPNGLCKSKLFATFGLI